MWDLKKSVSVGELELELELVTLRIHATDSSLAEASRERDWNLLRYSNPGTKLRSSSMNPAMDSASASEGGGESRSEEHSGEESMIPEESSPQRRKESSSSGKQLEQETDMAIGGGSFSGHGFRWGFAGKRSEKSPEVWVTVEKESVAVDERYRSLPSSVCLNINMRCLGQFFLYFLFIFSNIRSFYIR